MSLQNFYGFPTQNSNWQCVPQQQCVSQQCVPQQCVPQQCVTTCQVPVCQPQCCCVEKKPCKVITCECSSCNNRCDNKWDNKWGNKWDNRCDNKCNKCDPCHCKPICNPGCQPICNPCPPICNPCQPICDTRVALITTPTGPQTIQNNPTPFPFARVINWNLSPQNSVGCITFNAVTGEFTVPKTGYYAISVYITWDINSAGNREIWINHVPCGSNTPTVLAADTRVAGQGVPTRVTLSTEAYLNAGDRIFVSVFQDSGAPNGLQIFPAFQQGNKISIILLQ